MEREHCFEGYTKGRYYEEKKYLKTGTGEYQRPTGHDKRCNHCQHWALYYGNYKDFWCKHRKGHMQKFHPSTRLSE